MSIEATPLLYTQRSFRRILREYSGKIPSLINTLRFHIFSRASQTRNVEAGAERLRGARMLSNVTVGILFYRIKAQNSQFDYRTTGVDGGTINEEALPPLERGKTIAIPVVLKGFRPHIVNFLVKQSEDGTKTLEFYDSKGLTISDRGGEKTQGGQTLREIAEILKRQYGITQIRENTTKDQWDTFNCGVYVCHRVACEVLGHQPLSDPREMRRALATLVPAPVAEEPRPDADLLTF